MFSLLIFLGVYAHVSELHDWIIKNTIGEMIKPEPQLPANVGQMALLPGNLVCKNPFVRAGERLAIDKIVGGQDATRPGFCIFE